MLHVRALYFCSETTTAQYQTSLGLSLESLHGEVPSRMALGFCEVCVFERGGHQRN